MTLGETIKWIERGEEIGGTSAKDEWFLEDFGKLFDEIRNAALEEAAKIVEDGHKRIEPRVCCAGCLHEALVSIRSLKTKESV